MKFPGINLALNFHNNKHHNNEWLLELVTWTGQGESRLESALLVGGRSDQLVKAIGQDDPEIFQIVDGQKVHRKIWIFNGKIVGSIPLETMVATYKRSQKLKAIDADVRPDLIDAIEFNENTMASAVEAGLVKAAA